jgi:DNA-binding transcriptional LysR family regulator
MRDAAIAGDGIAVLPHFLIVDELRAGRLIELLPEFRLPQPQMKAVMPRKREIVPRTRQLVAFLQQHMAQLCPLRQAEQGR